MIDHKKRLEEALRQYRHNNSDEFVAGYDLQLIANLVNDLVQDNDYLRVVCGGMQLTLDEQDEQLTRGIAALKTAEHYITGIDHGSSQTYVKARAVLDSVGEALRTMQALKVAKETEPGKAQ